MKIMNKEERQRKIIGYITSNPDCHKEMVVKNFKGEISRVTVLKDLADLEKEGIISPSTTKKQNRRDHNLVVNVDNRLVSVSQELDEFEKAFFSLLDRSKVKFNTEYRIGKSNSKLNPLTQHPINILYDVITMYIFRNLLKWSVDIPDKEILRRLNSVVFTRVAEMHLRMNQILYPSLVGNFNQLREYFFISRKIYASDSLKKYNDSYNELGMKKEIEQLMEPLWKINKDLQEAAYPEPREYEWDFQYQKDDWRKFLELQNQNPEQTHDHYMQERFRKEESQFRNSRRSEIDTKNK